MPTQTSALAIWALGLAGLYVFLAIGVRMIIQYRRTGSSGFQGTHGEPGSVEWLANVLFVVGVGGGLAAPAFSLFGLSLPIGALDGSSGHTLGFVLCLLGLAATFAAQLAMGDSWRIGVDPKESTALVTGGPFQIVRNPIYSAMIPTCLGFVLLVPNAVAVAAWLALVVGLELHVRRVEEPYLLRVHGRAYTDYAARVGRFVPGMGRLAP